MVSWFESAMEESEKYIEDMSDCIPEIKDNCKPMTNADKIRNMDDAELAEFISSLVRNADDYLTSEGNWLIWLQSEAE